MSSPSTWAAPRPTSASSSTGGCWRPRRARSRARTSARRCCACARSAPAAGPSPGSARTACSRSAPRSAGSVPGPACYGRGGEEPTVTDANVALGALSGDTVLAGSLRLDAAARGARDRDRGQAARPRCAAGRRRDPAHRQHPDGGRPAPRLAGAGAGSRASLRSWPSAAPDRCMRPRLRAASGFRPCSFRPIPGSTAPSACCRPACATPISSPRSACSAVSRPAG